ncbi:MAG TPA: gamma-glutamyl-gamma-aminobutyrate hydrolase family protein, partial [Verrucomicrobiota bacterium]|nr:gamma-glutamyl-gamma-aminobutyrate hydrolase family protein [Verrucomicrobiota bacterium]
LKVVRIDPEELETSGSHLLEKIDAILVPGASGVREVEGKILAAKYAREHHIPFLGICLGMQAVIIEYARNVLGLKTAHSAEFDSATEYPVIIPLENTLSTNAQPASHKQRRHIHLGARDCKLKSGSKARAIYAQEQISERHRNSYVFNNKYRELFEKEGNLLFSGLSTVDSLVELVELKGHPFFMSCQFHPEFQSKPHSPHPLFKEFIAAALAAKK